LGALTSVGGITGYVRTGSVPSIAAGLTVGALVGPLPLLLFLKAGKKQAKLTFVVFAQPYSTG
jgi:uncharacterized membrane protein (UPF0136 family)